MHIGLKSLDTSLQAREVGHAVLVHVKGEPDPGAVAFASGLAADVQNTLAVVDLPPGSLEGQGDAVAKMLSGRGNLRLAFVRAVTSREARAAGQRIADRLQRTVVIPDGEPVPTADGGLFVPSDHGTGWVAFRPGRGLQHESQRFPKPAWEFSTFSRPWETSEHTTVEPLPSGVWVRGAGRPRDIPGRTWLMRQLPCHPEIMTVVIGSPGGPAVPLVDVARFWETVLPTVRSRVRFVHYGPVSTPGGRAYGQEIADRLGQQVVVYAGMPLETTTGFQPPTVVSLHKQGTPESRPFVSELMYFPRTGERPAPPPALFGLRQPIAGVPEIATGVYEYAADAVLEVVQSGLWMRPPVEPADADDVRNLPAGPGRFAIFYDRSTPSTAERMRALAEDMLWRLDPATRGTFQVAPADDPWPVLLQGEDDTWSLAVEPAEAEEQQAAPRAQAPGRAGAALPSESEAPAQADRAGTAAGPAGLGANLAAGRRIRERRAKTRKPTTESAPQPTAAGTQSGPAGTPRTQTESAAAPTPPPPLAHTRVEMPPPGDLDGATATAGAGPGPVGPELPAETPASPQVPAAPPAPGPYGTPPVPATPWTGTQEPQDAVPHGVTPRDATPHGVTPRDATPRGGTPYGGTPQDTVPPGAAPQEPPRGPSGPGAPGGIPALRLASGAPDAPAAPPVPPVPSVPGAPGPADAPRPQPAPVPGAGPVPSAPPAPGAVPPPGPAPAGPLPGGPVPAPPAAQGPAGPTAPEDAAPAVPPATAPAPPAPATQDAAPAPAPRPAAPRIRLESAAPAGPEPATPAGAGAPGTPPAQDRPARPEEPAAPAPAPVQRNDREAAPTSQVAPPAPSGGPRVQVQPVPKAAACAAPGDRDIAKERDWVRRTFSSQYHTVSGAVSRVMSETPGLRGASRADAGDALTDLVAVKLYLSGDSGQVDRAVRSATVGPHVPLARCVASGLLRLPSYRGPSLVRVPASAAERSWFHEGRLVTEWGFCTARTNVEAAGSGNTDFLVWSMTARRTNLLDQDRPDQVVFVPGTSFKVLRVTTDDEAPGVKRPAVLMRELLPSEISDDGQVDVARVPLDEIALAGLEQALKVVGAVKENDSENAAAGPAPGSGWPPGLISAHRAAPPAPQKSATQKSVHNEGAKP